jgi:hypothetical protein
MLTRKFFESRLSEMPFPGLWGDILQNYDDQKTTLWHIRGPGQCFCSTAWALGPPFGPLGLGAPAFARSEPIVVTPLSLALDKQRTSLDNDDAFLSSLLFTFETLTPSPSREYKEVSQCRKSRLIIVFEFRFSIIITRVNCMLPLYVLAWVLSTTTSLIKEVMLYFYAEVYPHISWSMIQL